MCIAGAAGGFHSSLHVRPLLLTLGTRGYFGYLSTYTFWRFLIEIPLTESEMKIQYSINGGLELDFFVPSRRQTMRLAAHSVSE
jgi:hypothetical protein